MNLCNTPLPTTIDGVSGGAQIAEVWRRHFDDLFNSHRQLCNDYKLDGMPNKYEEICVSRREIERAIKHLDKNKSCGLDGIYAEHLKFASTRLLDLLSDCFSSLLVHGALPDSMISVVLLPVIKDKAGNITSKDNYRPMALASIVSKVMEIVVLNRMSEYISTRANQFGFKKKHSTDQCIYVMKEIIDTYRALNGSMFVCCLVKHLIGRITLFCLTH